MPNRRRLFRVSSGWKHVPQRWVSIGLGGVALLLQGCVGEDKSSANPGGGGDASGDDSGGEDTSASAFVHAEYTNLTIPLETDAATRLDFSSKPGTSGGMGQLEVLSGMTMRWDDAGTVSWRVQVPEAGDYRAQVSYASIKAGAQISVVSDGASLTAELGKSVAPFEQELRLSDIPDLDIDEEYLYTYDRQFFEGELSFAEGEQMVSIFVDGLQPDEVVDFRALELIPVAALADLEAEETQAEEQRADTNWMVDAKYGVMFHWTDMTVNEDGSQIDYKTAVDGFDVEAFGALSEEVGAGYVIFTVNHQYPHCPAPIAAWEAIHPGWTTERDLIGEIADELNGRDIQLVLYVASHLVGNPDGGREVRWLRAHEYGSSVEIPEASHFDIFENNKAVLTAIGERYGERVAGFWLDGWDLIPEVYPHSDFRALFDASKTGNPDRVVAFNRWVFPTVTPWQDYWAGEIDSPDKSPTEQIMTTEVGKGLQYQALIAMEDDWLYSQEGLSWGPNTYKLRYTVNELVRYINEVHAVRGAVTINLAIRQDGTIQPKALERMIAVKAAVH